MATKRRCPACGRLQRVPEDAEDFICDGCGGQGGSEYLVRRVPPGLARRFLGAGLMLVGGLCAISLIDDIIRWAMDAKWEVTKDRVISLVIPALLFIAGVTLARGERELVPYKPVPDESHPDLW
jgi:hypothetical protein